MLGIKHNQSGFHLGLRMTEEWKRLQDDESELQLKQKRDKEKKSNQAGRISQTQLSLCQTWTQRRTNVIRIP